MSKIYSPLFYFPSFSLNSNRPLEWFAKRTSDYLLTKYMQFWKAKLLWVLKINQMSSLPLFHVLSNFQCTQYWTGFDLGRFVDLGSKKSKTELHIFRELIFPSPLRIDSCDFMTGKRLILKNMSTRLERVVSKTFLSMHESLINSHTWSSPIFLLVFCIT